MTDSSPPLPPELHPGGEASPAFQATIAIVAEPAAQAGELRLLPYGFGLLGGGLVASATMPREAALALAGHLDTAEPHHGEAALFGGEVEPDLHGLVVNRRGLTLVGGGWALMVDPMPLDWRRRLAAHLRGYAAFTFGEGAGAGGGWRGASPSLGFTGDLRRLLGRE
ncbi:hypothetical protein NON00_23195 [Roseomonas sp. GC11]|uniref:hypothetical protein n=1 Tax=Roseomonas sp. GC11 TaxID=2950546 RepID=UPI0021087DD9|nr:hypothetical protein [Roseomonas sp. GC11]MCQ4162813.1 hypothetical protein [Roseomonas sp. GC11]